MSKGLPVVLAAMLALVVGCSGDQEAVSEGDIAAAERFQRYPLYWGGRRFEGWELTRVAGLPDTGPPGFVSFDYGSCEIEDPDGLGPEGGSCSPPLTIQAFPLCSHLPAVARAPIWRRRQLRGAPVGTIDSAPVLFTAGAQVKVYGGQGSDRGCRCVPFARCADQRR